MTNRLRAIGCRGPGRARPPMNRSSRRFWGGRRRRLRTCPRCTAGASSGGRPAGESGGGGIGGGGSNEQHRGLSSLGGTPAAVRRECRRRRAGFGGLREPDRACACWAGSVLGLGFWGHVHTLLYTIYLSPTWFRVLSLGSKNNPPIRSYTNRIIKMIIA